MLRLSSALVALSFYCVSAVTSPPGAVFFHSFEKGLGPFAPSEAEDYSGQKVVVEVADANDVAALILKEKAQRYAVTALLDAPIGNDDDGTLVVQYEVRLTEGLECGGAYLKLYHSDDSFTTASVHPSTPYVIMFGPDRCGATDKVHFIIRWYNPVSRTFEEKHVTNAPRPVNDKLSHLYTLIIRPDASFTIKIDNEDVRSGSLGAADDFMPSILPLRQIDDPSDVKPEDWVDLAQIADPNAVKPADWDETAPATIDDADAVKPNGWLDDEAAYVADPAALKPEEWDTEEDGVWEAPTIANPKCDAAPGCGEWHRPSISNPAYKGPWYPPRIANPAYKGEWAPAKIDNPSFFEDLHLSRLGGATIGAVGVEVWTMNGGIAFNNILIGRDEAAAESFGSSTWSVKHAAQAKALKEASLVAESTSRAAAAESGGFAEKALFYYGEASNFVKRNPAVTAATVVLLFISTIAMIFFSGSSNHAPKPLILETEEEIAASIATRRDLHANVNASSANPVSSEPEDDAPPPSSAKKSSAKPSPAKPASPPLEEDDDDSAAPVSTSSKGSAKRAPASKDADAPNSSSSAGSANARAPGLRRSSRNHA